MYIALSSDLLCMLYLSLYGLGWRFVERHGPAVAVCCRVAAAVGSSFASVRKDSIYKDPVLSTEWRIFTCWFNVWKVPNDKTYIFCFVFVEHDITFSVRMCLSLFLRAILMCHYITFFVLMGHYITVIVLMGHYITVIVLTCLPLGLNTIYFLYNNTLTT